MEVRYHFMEDEISEFSMYSGDFCNEVTLNYAYDYEDGQYKSSITKHNPISKLLYGDAKKTLDLQMIQMTRQAEKVADMILRVSSTPELRVTILHDIRSLLVEVGDTVRLQHRAAIGKDITALVTKKTLQKEKIRYELSVTPSHSLFISELIMLTQTTSTGTRGVSITYDKGVATITVYADVAGYPPIEGAEVTIQGNKKITDKLGQVRFNLLSGTYTAYLTASGYEATEITFTV